MPVYDALFTKVGGRLVNFFGLTPSVINESVTWLETGFFEVQLLKEIGFIGTILFAEFLILMGYVLFNYLKSSEDKDEYKTIFVVMLLAFFVYESLFYRVSIAPHEESYSAFLRSPLLLVMLFIFGYVFTIPAKKEEEHE